MIYYSSKNCVPSVHRTSTLRKGLNMFTWYTPLPSNTVDTRPICAEFCLVSWLTMFLSDLWNCYHVSFCPRSEPSLRLSLRSTLRYFLLGYVLKSLPTVYYHRLSFIFSLFPLNNSVPFPSVPLPSPRVWNLGRNNRLVGPPTQFTLRLHD